MYNKIGKVCNCLVDHITILNLPWYQILMAYKNAMLTKFYHGKYMSKTTIFWDDEMVVRLG